ncbi:MAG TPA: DHA2 family efflux MFS transporter permease subunit [Stellaceae bacterium]|nr:DHA2 family efflux MFS transporter permease subunit [Stellaceae bacterium]
MTLEAGAVSLAGRRQATVALMIATAMQAFDATIANVALPQLEHGFGGGVDLGSWVMTSYLCASAVTAIMTGWLRRRWGARRVFCAAVALFVAASLLCAVATSSDALIVFRLIQGAAAGVIQPLSQAIILDIHPKAQHGRMLAIWGATIMAGPMLGPVLGGLITDLSSWRWIFAVNAPIGAVALLGVAAVPSATEAAGAGRIDGVGIIMLAVATASLQLALQRSIGRLWPPSPETVAAAGLAILAWATIAIQTRRARFGLFRFEIFRDVNFAVAALYNFLVGAVLFTTIVFVPALGEGPLAWNATQAGLAISPRGIGTMAMMLGVRHVIDRVDHRILLGLGLAITAGALGFMAHVPAEAGGTWLAAASAAQGVGVGLLFTPLSALAFSTLAADERTDGAGVYNLARQLGCATGVAAMTAVLQARMHIRLGELLRLAGRPGLSAVGMHQAASFGAYTDCFRVLALIALAMLPGVLLFLTIRRDAPATSGV